MNEFLSGATAMACFTAGLFFFKYWRNSSERLLLIFAAAFWVGLALVSVDAEDRPFFYVARFAAFTLIIAGIVDKNRSPARARRRPP
jgi:uncharacterized membrane protein YccC